MDDDEAGGLTSGISGGAGYLLGRMAADRDRRMAEFTRRVFNPEPPRRKTYDAAEVHEVIDGWKASVRSKDKTIEQLRAHNTSLTTERDQLLARVAGLEAHAAERQADLASLERAERGANAMLRDRTDQLEDLELAVARMSAQLADLQTENERLRQGGN